MNGDEIKIWFDSAVDLLISNGNKIEKEHYGTELSPRWRWDKEGGHCILTKPLDLNLISKTLTVPPSVILDHEFGMIKTAEEYLDIKQRMPIHGLPGFINPKTDPTYVWSPIKIYEDSLQISLIQVKEQLLKINAEFIGDKLDIRKYVLPFSENYKQGTWRVTSSMNSEVYFFYESNNQNDFQSGYVSIGLLTNKTHKQEAEISQLIDYIKPIAKNLKAKLWNDQYQEWIQTN